VNSQTNVPRPLCVWLCLPVIPWALSACVTMNPVTAQSYAPPAQRHEVIKNYTIGQPMTVNVGEPMIKHSDYWVTVTEARVVSPERTVTLKGGIVNITLNAGQKYPVQGHMQFEGSEYAVVEISSQTAFGRTGYDSVLIRPDGTLLPRKGGDFGRGVVLDFYDLTISDPTVRLLGDTQESIVTTKGYENFEVLYTGTNASALTLTYREFSPEGMARVAFFQNLTYEANAKVVTFKKYRMAIDRATSEKITFTVLEDGT
jgi:hypothetical protein